MKESKQEGTKKLLPGQKLQKIFLVYPNPIIWQLVSRRIWCVSVGFVYRSTDIVSSTRLDLVSRNTCCLVETSAVNFMLGWKLLASSRKAVKVSRPCEYFMSISSMNLSHENGLTDFNSCPSRRPMNMLAYVGAVLVPIAVPWTWR